MMHLVRDNIHAMPSSYVPDISNALRAYAELLEDGEISARKVIVIALDDDGMIDFAALGQPFDSAQAIGYLEMAKAQLMRGSWR